MATSTAENSSVVGGLHKSRCENCKRDIDLATNAGHAQGCNYTWGRRGWRQLGEYDG